MLTVAQAANRLGMKQATIRLWLSQRRLVYCRLGRSIRIPEAEVERVIRESTIPARENRR